MRHLHLLPLLFLSACMGAENTAPKPSIETPERVEKVMAPVETPSAEEPVQVPLPPPDPDRLSGLNPKEVQSLMGEPTLVRRDENVQFMLFETQSCVFEIIFYEPDLDAHFKASRMNARTRTGTDIDLQACLVSILPEGQWLANASHNQ